MTLPRMSHSRFEDYSNCGEMYRLKRIERVPTTPSIFSLAGIVFHEWTDWFDQPGRWARTPDDYVDSPNSDPHPHFLDESKLGLRLEELVAHEEEASGYALREWDTPNKRQDSNAKQLVKFRDELLPDWAEKYKAWRKETGWHIADLGDDSNIRWGIEVELNTTAGGVEVIAFVDRIFYRPDTKDLVAIDSKTWSKRRTTAQLPTYLVLLRKLGLNVVGAAYYEARKGECTPIKDYKYWDENRLAALHEQAARGIEARFFVPRISEDCFMCDVKRHCTFAP